MPDRTDHTDGIARCGSSVWPQGEPAWPLVLRCGYGVLMNVTGVSLNVQDQPGGVQRPFSWPFNCPSSNAPVKRTAPSPSPVRSSVIPEPSVRVALPSQFQNTQKPPVSSTRSNRSVDESAALSSGNDRLETQKPVRADGSSVSRPDVFEHPIRHAIATPTISSFICAMWIRASWEGSPWGGECRWGCGWA